MLRRFSQVVLWVVTPRSPGWKSMSQRKMLPIYSHRDYGGIMSFRNFVPPPFKHELFNAVRSYPHNV